MDHALRAGYPKTKGVDPPLAITILSPFFYLSYFSSKSN